jgi:hypothetical protein
LALAASCRRFGAPFPPHHCKSSAHGLPLQGYDGVLTARSRQHPDSSSNKKFCISSLRHLDETSEEPIGRRTPLIPLGVGARYRSTLASICRSLCPSEGCRLIRKGGAEAEDTILQLFLLKPSQSPLWAGTYNVPRPRFGPTLPTILISRVNSYPCCHIIPEMSIGVNSVLQRKWI